MNEQTARQILGDAIEDDDSLNSRFHEDDDVKRNPMAHVHGLFWSSGNPTITIDAEVPVEVLEAIVWWVKNKSLTQREKL